MADILFDERFSYIFSFPFFSVLHFPPVFLYLSIFSYLPFRFCLFLYIFLLRKVHANFLQLSYFHSHINCPSLAGRTNANLRSSNQRAVQNTMNRFCKWISIMFINPSFPPFLAFSLVLPVNHNYASSLVRTSFWHQPFTYFTRLEYSSAIHNTETRFDWHSRHTL